MKLNEKLEIMLARKRLKRVEFADSVGITYRAFAYYMNGSRTPRRNILERMAKELGVTPEFLLDDSIDIELTSEEKLIRSISESGNNPCGTIKFLEQSRGLFAGNALSDEDKENLVCCLKEIYEDSLRTGK